MTSPVHSAAFDEAHPLRNQSTSANFSRALTTPISAPPAMKPDAISVPRSKRALLRSASSFERVRYEPGYQSADYQRGVQLHRDEHTQCESESRNADRGQHQRQPPRRRSRASTGSGRRSSGAGSRPPWRWPAEPRGRPRPPNPYDLLRIIITPATVAAATNVPRNFHASCLRGVVRASSRSSGR